MPSQLEDIVQQLQEWSQQQDLIEEAIRSCHINLQNWEKEDKEIGLIARWKVSDILLHFDHQALVFKHDVLSDPFIDTQIGLYVAASSKGWFRDLEPIGKYGLITTLDGQVSDDYLIFDNAYETT